MNYKKYLCILVFLFVFLPKTYAGDLVYPIQKMSKPACRFQDYSTLGDDCKQDLPILHTADYEKYKNDYSVYRRVYTVLWGASYDYGWDVGNGGHSGIDIATAKGTPVVAIADGKVVKAKTLSGRGNTVKIEHTINGKTVYSDYAHMSAISVKEGDTVKAGDKVGEVGATGNATGNHLHFQIDVTKASGPRYRTNCSEKNYNTIVNTNVCFSELNTNTVDPLLFLESKASVIKSPTVIKKPTQTVISTTGLRSNEDILKQEINEFLAKYNLSASIQNYGGNLELNKPGTLRVSVSEKLSNKPFDGNFPGTMTFKYDDKKLGVFPTGIFAIDNGYRDITITAKQAGFQTLDVYIGQSLVTKITIGVLDSSKQITPSTGYFTLPTENVISDIKNGSIYFKTKDGISILGVPFNGTYTLTSSDGTLKFCIKQPKVYKTIDYAQNQNCSEFDFVRDASFSYADSFSGNLIFDYKITGNQKTNVEIQASNGGQIAYNAITPSNPKGLTTSYSYYQELIELGKNGVITGVNNGYYTQDRELVFKDALGYIRNTLAYQKTLCSDQTCKNTINSKITTLKKFDQTRYYTLKLNRYQFIQLVRYSVIAGKTYGTPIAFRDLNNSQQSLVGVVLKSNTWKDTFGQTRYFQPTRYITRGEAAFVIYNYIK